MAPLSAAAIEHLRTVKDAILNRWIERLQARGEDGQGESETPFEFHRRGLESLLSLFLEHLSGNNEQAERILDYLRTLVTNGFLAEYPVNRLVETFHLLETLVAGELAGHFGDDRETRKDVARAGRAIDRLVLACCRFYEERVARFGGRFEELFEKSSLINFYLDGHGRILRVNKAATSILGDGDVVGTNFTRLVSPKDLAQFTRMLGFALQGDPQIFEMEFTPGGGDPVHLSMTISPVAAEGHIAGVQVVATDITEERQLQARLRSSEEKYRKLIENANDAIVLFRVEDGRIVDTNIQAVELTGYRRKELTAMSLPQLFAESDRDRSIALIQETISEGSSTLDGLVLQAKDGRDLIAEVSSNVIEYGGHKVIQSIVRDMTRRHQLEQKLTDRTREMERIHRRMEVIQDRVLHMETALLLETTVVPLLEDADRRFRRLAEHLSAVREDVRRIRARFDEAAGETDTESGLGAGLELAERDLMRCEDEAVRLSRTARNLLPQPVTQPERAAVDLNRTCEAAISLLSHRFGGRVAARHEAGDIPVARLDPDRADQAVYLAVRSALARVGGAGRIVLSTRVEDGRVQVRVADNAPALTQEQVRRILDPYPAPVVIETRPGHDLKMCRQLLSWMGGAFLVEPAEGRGNTVVLEFPVSPTEGVPRTELTEGRYDLLVVDKGSP